MATIRPALHHVTFKTSRLQEMIDWYKKLIGVEVTFQDENNAWTSNDNAKGSIKRSHPASRSLHSVRPCGKGSSPPASSRTSAFLNRTGSFPASKRAAEE